MAENYKYAHCLEMVIFLVTFAINHITSLACTWKPWKETYCSLIGASTYDMIEFSFYSYSEALDNEKMCNCTCSTDPPFFMHTILLFFLSFSCITSLSMSFALIVMTYLMVQIC